MNCAQQESDVFENSVDINCDFDHPQFTAEDRFMKHPLTVPKFKWGDMMYGMSLSTPLFRKSFPLEDKVVEERVCLILNSMFPELYY